LLNSDLYVLEYTQEGGQLRCTNDPCQWTHLTPTAEIPSLDGLRAISIAFVLFAHLTGMRGFPVSTALGRVVDFGDLGVHVFLVISGYLITRLLLEELERRQRISLGRFYLRRTLRIFPPYYTLILALVVAQAAGWL
jgi:peptidoglycan/LPS O-acetylase OafA/YrhL